MNYCRRISKGTAVISSKSDSRVKRGAEDIIFFEHVPPFAPEHYSDYAFWHLPTEARARTFHGHLIGESSDLRAQRIGG